MPINAGTIGENAIDKYMPKKPICFSNIIEIIILKNTESIAPSNIIYVLEILNCLVIVFL